MPWEGFLWPFCISSLTDISSKIKDMFILQLPLHTGSQPPSESSLLIRYWDLELSRSRNWTFPLGNSVCECPPTVRGWMNLPFLEPCSNLLWPPSHRERPHVLMQRSPRSLPRSYTPLHVLSRVLKSIGCAVQKEENNVWWSAGMASACQLKDAHIPRAP